jgi:KaiC/GvpD/RAD55 family RecA-like ATPase
MIDSLDALIESGFFRGIVILVAGRTGSGKTILSTQLICNCAIHDNAGVGRRKVLAKNP